MAAAAEENENIAIHSSLQTIVIRVRREEEEEEEKQQSGYGWIAIEPKTKSILNMCISSLERSILVAAEQFLKELIKKSGKYPVSTTTATMIVVVYGIIIHNHVDF